MSFRHGRHCRCHTCCQKTIVHPTKFNCVNQFSESVVNQVHPSHTTVMNHHLVKNIHTFPHSTSVQNTANSVDQYGGSFQVPAPNQVAGAMSPGFGPGYGPGGQVAGAMMPGYGPGSQVAGAMMPGYGPGGQVAGAMMPGYGQGPHKGCKCGCGGNPSHHRW
ncbi:spore coat protein [Oceanobacillus arenosus]|uniref:Spore coat protein n=1 Tax=Oceanobacillus arenosus TaxID=1229153 RepID=A0A3D8PN98_9BACI|nr:spore coat protein [Oceanobacillus arenosus]RDW17580.1 spore coat protein [Oceanobacillus arenosus]